MRSCVVSRCWKWEICSPSRKIVHILVTKIRVMFFTFRVNEVSVSCCCAGAWCIASAPLILGHDLANEATNSKIWPIITNKAAIRVSQSFATGSTFHPGGHGLRPHRRRLLLRLQAQHPHLARRCIYGVLRRMPQAGLSPQWESPGKLSTCQVDNASRVLLAKVT
jgi:hypothetical protein